MNSFQFWDALAPIHGLIEDNLFDRASVNRIRPELREPVLVIGAGQGLIVEELRRKSLRCDGVDFSPEMVRHAKIRRGLELFQADARALPFRDGAYGTVIYATGVIDFTADEDAIGRMLGEGRRVANANVFVAFYRASAAQEGFLVRLGVLRDNVLSQRECFRTYLLNPAQMVGWVARHAAVGSLRATALLLRMAVGATMRETILTLKMQKILRSMADPNVVIQAAPETIPYRNEAEIRRMFQRLAIPIETIRRMPGCWIVRLGSADKPVDRGQTATAAAPK